MTISQFESFMNASGFKFNYDSCTIPENDTGLLFKISGGVNYNKNIIENIPVPSFSSAQLCIRGEKKGKKKVGFTGKHHFLFEMLGHFSIGNLKSRDCRETMIETAFNFLIKECNIPSQDLLIIAHPEDKESIEIISKLTDNYQLNSENVNNFPPQRCYGYRVEFAFQPKKIANNFEMWNIVFTDGDIFEGEKIPRTLISADSGMSLDRLITAIERVDNDYQNSNWQAKLKGIYPKIQDKDICPEMKRLAEYILVISNLTENSIVPGPKFRSYYLRRLIRNSLELSVMLDIPFEEFEIYSHPVVSPEIEKYKQTFNKGLRQYQSILAKQGGIISQEQIEALWSTHGFKPEFIGGGLA
jgi:alanyl-tRNA synthetase